MGKISNGGSRNGHVDGASSELMQILRDLFRSLKDPVVSVREAVQISLVELGMKRSNVVISYLHSILTDNLKRGTLSPVCPVLLDVLNAILTELPPVPADLPLADLVKTVCQFVEKESPLVGVHATKVLARLSIFHCTEVMEQLLAVMAKTERPSLNVIEVSGQLALYHTNNIMQLLPVLLTQTMKYLPEATDDQIRAALTTTLGQYCDSALEYLSITQDAVITWDTVLELLSSHTCAAVDIILNTWLPNTKETVLLTSIYTNFGSIASLTEAHYLLGQLPKMLNFFTASWRRVSSPAMELALCQSLNTFISTVIRRSKTVTTTVTQRPTEGGSLLSRLSVNPKPSATSGPTDIHSVFASELDSLVTCLFQHLFQIAQRQSLAENSGCFDTYTKVLREIKRAFATLSFSYPGRILLAVQFHLTSGSELSRTITVDLLRHLVSAGPSSSDRSPFSKTMQQQILNSVLHLLFGTGVSLPGFQLTPGSIVSGAGPTMTSAKTTTIATALSGMSTDSTPAHRSSSLRHSLMGDVVHGAPLGPDRDSLLLGEIASGENVAPPIRVELIKLVLTLGSLGYLDLQGGHVLVEFVVRQSALTQASLTAHDKGSRGRPSPREIHNLCVHVMKLSSTTVSTMQPVLWPFLLEFLLLVDCTEAVGIICDSIANLLSKPQSNLSTDETLPDSTQASDMHSQEIPNGSRRNVPSSQRLFVRLVVLLGLPISGGNRGLPILRLMLAMARQIHSSLPILWNLVLPQMKLYLNQDHMFQESDELVPNTDLRENSSFSINHWQDLTLKMLLKSIEQIADEKWTIGLVREFEGQIPLYDKLPDERGFLCRCLGMTLSKVRHQPTVLEAAELIIQSINHHSADEQECCADALGVISTSHGELILDLLTRQVNALDSYSPIGCPDKRSGVNRVQPSNGPGNLTNASGGVVLNTGSGSSGSSVPKRFTNLFRQHTSSSVSKSDQAYVRPLPAYFGGSVEAVRATTLQGFTRSLRHMPIGVSSVYLDQIFKQILEPMSSSPDVSSSVRLALIDLVDQLGHVIRSLVAMPREDGATDTPELPAATPLGLVYCLLEILNQDLLLQSIQVSTIRNTHTQHCDSLGFPDPAAQTAPIPHPCAINRTIRLKAVETIAGLLEADFIPALISSSLMTTTAMVFLYSRDAFDHTDRLTNSPDGELRSLAREVCSLDAKKTTDLVEWSVIQLWLRLIQLACSDELIAEMIKILVPYLHDPAAHVRYRTLCLFAALLTATLKQLATVANSSNGLSLCGQLLGHLVTRLGDTGSIQPSESVRRQAKLALQQLLQIFVLFSADTGSLPPADRDESDIMNGTSTGTCTRRSDHLLNELAQHVPQRQIPQLLDLIWSGLLRYAKDSVRADSIDTLEPGESSDESAAKSTEKLHCSTGLFGSPCGLQHSPRPVVATSASSDQFFSAVIPRTKGGYLIRLLIGLLRHRGGNFAEGLVSRVVHAVYSVYPKLLTPRLRAGLLLAVAELGKNWPVLCLQAISANPLPLNFTWSIILAAVAFLPVGHNSIFSTTSADVTSIPKSLSSDIACARSLPRILKHVLHVLECCLPYERREVPLDSSQWSSKRDQVSSDSTGGPKSGEVRFITHACLASINCLQILSYPVDVDELVHYDHAEHWSLRLCLNQSALRTKQPERTKRRLFPRSFGSGTLTFSANSIAPLATPPRAAAASMTTATSVAEGATPTPATHRSGIPHSSISPLTAYLTEPPVFCQVLGYLLLSHATAVTCRTPVGKSYENRSGAEANLKHGVPPLTISSEGLHGFLETCGMNSLLRALTVELPKAVTFMTMTDTQSSSEGIPNKCDPLQVEQHRGLLWNSDSLLEVVDIVGRYVMDTLSSAHFHGLVQFFLGHLNSTYEPHRLVATKWLACVLSHGSEKSPIFTEPSSSEQGSIRANSSSVPLATADSLFGQLLNRLEDPYSAVRRIAVNGLGDIGNSVGCRQSSTDHPSSDNPAAKLIWRHSVAITRGLFLLLDDKNESDVSMLHDVLHSLSCTIPYANVNRIGPLIGELCQRLWPVYASTADSVRAAAFELFGALTAFAWDPSSEADPPRVSSVSHGTLFAESQSVLIPVLLHLADPSPSVVDVCKTTLKKLAPILFASSTSEDRNNCATSQIECSPKHESEARVKVKAEECDGEKRLLDFFSNCLRPDLKLHQGEFFNELARLLVSLRPDQVTDYTMRCTVFYNSDWPEIQCSAVLFSGFLIGHFTPEILETFPRGQVCHQLLQLLRSNDPEVRATAAHAVSRLYRF